MTADTPDWVQDTSGGWHRADAITYVGVVTTPAETHGYTTVNFRLPGRDYDIDYTFDVVDGTEAPAVVAASKTARDLVECLALPSDGTLITAENVEVKP